MGFLFNTIQNIPLRFLGLKYVPGIPIRLRRGMLDTFTKLKARVKEITVAEQKLSSSYTINGITAKGFEFLFGKTLERNKDNVLSPTIESLERNPTKIKTNIFNLFIGEENSLAPLADLSSLTSLSLENPEQWTISITHHNQIYEKLEPHFPRWIASLKNADEASKQFWPTIANGFSYNLLVLKKIGATDLENLKLQFSSVWLDEWEILVESGVLYCIDMSIFSTVKTSEVDGFPRFTPSTITLLQQDPQLKVLNPIAVRVAGYNEEEVQIYTRHNSTESAWIYALLAAKTSITVYGIWCGHVYHWHIVPASMQMTMYNNLPEEHTLYKLIDPQSNYLTQFNEILLLIWGAIAPPTSIASSKQFLRLMNTFAKDRNYFDDDPLTALEQHSIEEQDFSVNEPWDQYPIVAHYLKIWKVVDDYISTIVDATYLDDSTVVEDKALREWMEDAANRDEGNIKGLPKMNSKDALKKVLTSLIYRLTVHGGSRLSSRSALALMFVPNFPPCLQKASIPTPNTTMSTKELLEYLPNTGSIGRMVGFLYIFLFSTPYESFIPQEGVDAHLFFPGGKDDPRNQALIQLRNAMIEFITEFQGDLHPPQIHQWPLNIET